MIRSKGWLTDILWKPKKPHSLEQLRYLHYILTKNITVTESNRGLLVETLRSIAEILIWGDQNDSRVFDFFLEKNVFLNFLKILNQNCGSYVCVQMLQTLSILFENIRNTTSLYFLFSNNHVNSIIIHKFDFSDEEVLAYYISFVKTLSLKLNKHTIHFFFNERKNDFPLYTEAIKFFNHSESMVRIAVRTLTLNVYRVGERNMLTFIRDKTADPYFSNLVWFIGSHTIELDNCAQNDSDHLKCDRLKNLVAEHLDNLHYLNDILGLGIVDINEILTVNMLDRMLIPLYIYSLIWDQAAEELKSQPHISCKVALFLLSQVLLITSHGPLVSSIVDVILNGDECSSDESPQISPASLRKDHSTANSVSSLRVFTAPEDTLEASLVAHGVNTEGYTIMNKVTEFSRQRSVHVANSKFYLSGSKKQKKSTKEVISVKDENSKDLEPSELTKRAPSTGKLNGIAVPIGETPLGENSEDEGKDWGPVFSKGEQTKQHNTTTKDRDQEVPVQEEANYTNLSRFRTKSLLRRPQNFHPNWVFMRTILGFLDCSETDEKALFALCLFFGLLKNKGVDIVLLEKSGLSTTERKVPYNEQIVEQLIRVLDQGSRNGSKVRLVTLQMAITILKELVLYVDEQMKQSYLTDRHLAFVESVREACTLQLRHFYKGDEIFLDMFEDEYNQMKMKPLNVEYLMMDASLLLPPTSTPLTGIEFSKRLPCGEVEQTRRAIRVFLMLRELCLSIRLEKETQLPLSKVENSVKLDDVLDLNNSDLIACSVKMPERNFRRFLVIDEAQFILVEPDTTKLGWGVVKFVARLQDVETSPDKEDSRSLFVTVHKPFTGRSYSGVKVTPMMSAKFVFDDYIRCMSARQRLQRRRSALRQQKLHSIAQLLELPTMAAPPQHYYSITPPPYINMGHVQGYTGTMSGQVYPRQGWQQPEQPATSQSAPVLENQVSPSTPVTSSDPSSCTENNSLPSVTDARTTLPLASTNTVTQAQALANVLESASPDRPDGASQPEKTSTIKERSGTIEIAEEVIEDTSSRSCTPGAATVKSPQGSPKKKGRVKTVASDTEFSEPMSDTGSESNASEISLNLSSPVRRTERLVRSAPASPRGGRHLPPIDPSEMEDFSKLLAANSMSEPAIFLRFTETKPKLKKKKSSKSGNRPTAPKLRTTQRGKGRKR